MFCTCHLEKSFLGQDLTARTRVHVFQACVRGHGKDATLVAEPFRQFEIMSVGMTRIGVLDHRYFVRIGLYTGAGEETGVLEMNIIDCEQQSVIQKGTLPHVDEDDAYVLDFFSFSSIIQAYC